MITKQKIISIAIFLSLTAGFLALFPVAPVGAQINPGDPDVVNEQGDEEEKPPDCEPGTEGCCGGVKTSVIGGDLCGSTKEGDSVIFNMLKLVLKIMTAGVGVAAVGGIAWGALLYTTAGGSAEQTKKAIGIITNVVIGIAAYALMAVFLNFLIPGGIFTQ